MSLRESIETELKRADYFIALLEPSPNRDESELKILRSCHARIRSYLDPVDKKTPTLDLNAADPEAEAVRYAAAVETWYKEGL